MNVRLVAYRKATSSAGSTTAYNLDLQEAPNVSLNFQFSDIKEPESRKSSYSQTFKLPFTDNNHQFFQDWYNVNLETLVFNTRTKFDAILYVGTVPQFEGSLQLKSVYTKAGVYEVVMMSSGATLFSTIGEKRLKDVFKNENGSYSADLNHAFTNTQMVNSWNGASSAFVNAAGASLRDSDAGVQKVMYPISVTQDKFYFNENDIDASGNDIKRYLRLDASAITAIDDATISSDISVPITQFRPSIQLKEMFNRILANAGFSYTSSFIDGSYFGKLFMTTGNHLETPTIPTTNTNAAPSGIMDVGNSAAWGIETTTSTAAQEYECIVPADTVTPTTGNTAPQDPDDVWNQQYDYFTRADNSMMQVSVSHFVEASNIAPYIANSPIEFKAILRPFDAATAAPDFSIPSYGESITWNITTTVGNTLFIPWDYTISLENMPVGASAQIVVQVSNYKSSGGTMTLTLGSSTGYAWMGWLVGNDLYSNIRMDWVGYSTDTYGATIDVPACIDPEITQRQFLKDIIQRFNLVILTNPDDDTNLIIEPYNDFIASGELKHWSEKLDTSKEIIVKDTTDIQKKIVHLTDQEDVDLFNKSIKERYSDVNVFGHLKITNFNNDFAKGELKNESIFSPFINSQVFAGEDTQLGTYLPNFSPQYEFSYDEKDGQTENTIKATKPKLFYYCGTATTVLSVDGTTTSYNLHRTYDSSGTLTVTAYNFTTYPVCSPFDITPGAGSNPANTYALMLDNNSLYWNSTPPIVGNLSVFNYNNDIGSWFNNTLYGKYWKPYLDNIYSSQARIMECYLNLNEVDIFSFSFADEIFIKDSYWRILNIHNYQVGSLASTKVTLIKSLDSKENCEGCDYVPAKYGDNNLYGDTFFLWCADSDPGCTPVTTLPSVVGAYTSPECCSCNGGMVLWNWTSQAANGLYPCIANTSSLPIRLKNIFGATDILDTKRLKSIVFDKLGGLNRPLVRGVYNTKYDSAIMPLYGDDMVIKYGTKKYPIPQLQGESHRLILSGNTSGNTRGYAYPESNVYDRPLRVPVNSNMIIRVKGIATVIGGTSSTYPLGTTEAFAYYAAFKDMNGTITRIGSAGGVEEFSLTQGGLSTTCTLNIATSGNGILQFGLDDSQTDTKRLWQLSVDLDVNRINNMALAYDENWALYQNAQTIVLQNGDYLIWN